MLTGRPVLALDFASPIASAALAIDGRLLGERTAQRSVGAPRGGEPVADDPLRLIEATLAAAGVERGELGGIVALRGPGSFTGLRIACATALGLSQALALPATGVSTLEALALTASPGSGPVRAVVDALRGEWYTQLFERGAGRFELRPLDSAAIRRAGDWPAVPTVGFRPNGADAAGLPTLPAPPLAGVTAAAASLDRWPWELELLTRPHYLRAPAVQARPGGGA